MLAVVWHLRCFLGGFAFAGKVLDTKLMTRDCLLQEDGRGSFPYFCLSWMFFPCPQLEQCSILWLQYVFKLFSKLETFPL